MLCYQDPEIADYNSFYSADCTDANSRPALTISYTAVDDSHAVLEGETLALPTTRAAGTFTWSSSDTTVATVNSNGVVSGIRAGKVTITASLDGSEYKKYTVHVIIEDGVYQIRNNAGLYLGTNGGTSENTSVYLQSKADSGVYQLYQLWKVTYLGKGYYSVRPLYKVNMGMHANGTTGSAVDIVNVGMEDSLEDVLLINRWGIQRSADGDAYYLNHLGTANFGLKANGIIPSHGMGLTIEHNPGTDVFEWTFNQLTGVYLHDNNGNPTDIPDTFSKEVEMGGTYSTADMGIYLTTSNVDLAWSSDQSPQDYCG